MTHLYRDLNDAGSSSLLCPFIENSEAPLNGIPDILESLFDGFTFRVATRKSRTTDNKTAIFRVFSDDDFQIHLIDIRWVRYIIFRIIRPSDLS
jgi:hypothetical protein